jgi:hypothetical protein
MIASLLLATTLLSSALATGVRFEEVDCPLGEGLVRRYYKVSANTHGGFDSDLASYSTRGQFREHAVSTCPSNYFSAMGTQLSEPIPAAQVESITAAIATSRNTWVNRDDPTVWERYDTAARIARVRGQDPLEIAELYLNAAWTARDHAVGVYVGGLNGPEAARKILDVGQAEFKGNLTPEAIKLLRYNLSRVAHRGGFIAERDAHLTAFLALSTLTPAERSAGQRLQYITRVVEPAMHAHAMMALEEALARPGDPSRLARARYQLADLNRRVGQSDAAKQGFSTVVQSEEAPKELKSMAQFLLSQAKTQPGQH